MTKKIKRKRLNIKRTFVLILFIYIIGYMIYSFYKKPIIHIEVSGNNLISEIDIIKQAKLNNYPSIMKYTSNKIENNIKKLNLINKVKVKKSINRNIYIEVEEYKVLFYNNNINKVVLDNGNIIDNDYTLIGIPMFNGTLSNEELKEFVSVFKKIDDNILYEINTIELYPITNLDGTILSNDRFKIIMNDGNTIIINNDNMKVLNKYNSIYASLNNKSGTITIDGNEIDNLVFIPYGD